MRIARTWGGARWMFLMGGLVACGEGFRGAAELEDEPLVTQAQELRRQDSNGEHPIPSKDFEIEREEDGKEDELPASAGSPLVPFPELVDPNALDLDRMEQVLHQELRFDAVGYAFAITRDGLLKKTGAGGVARRAVDGGSVRMTVDNPIQVASVSKTIAAIAVLQLLEKNGLSVDTRIASYLPASWNLGSGWKDITFRHLLTHRSGVLQLWNGMTEAQRQPWDNDWDGLRYVVARSVQPGAPSGYKNANYALFRILIPALWKTAPGSPNIPELTETNYTAFHLTYMRQHVFTPAGVNSVACSELPGELTARAYNVTEPRAGGSLANTRPEECGGHAGWHLSARELARIMAYMTHDDSYLSPTMRELMDSGRLGWSGSSNTSGHGREGKYWKGGDWFTGHGRNIHTCVMKNRSGVEATLVVNSDIISGKRPCTLLKEAFIKAQ